MKDPAVLFYTQDFLTGTMLMTDEQKGKYITLLCLQHQNGKLSEKDMMKICGEYDAEIWAKFFEKDGYYYNGRMLREAEKRCKFTESRRKNLEGKAHMDAHMASHMAVEMDLHMENENEDDNTSFKKGNKSKVKSKEFYLAEREKTDNTSFHFFIDYLLGKNELNRPFSKILNMKDPIGHLRFEELQTLAAEHNTKIMDKVRGIENHKTQYASFNLTLTNWIKKENNVR